MATTGVKFFEPTSQLGALTGWTIQAGGSPQTSQNRASELGQDGDEIAWCNYGRQDTISCQYVSVATSGILAIPKAGQVLNGYHIDSVSVSFSQTEWPKMTISAHKHDTTRGGVLDANCRTYSGKLILPAGFGIPYAFGTDFSLSKNTKLGIRSATYTLSVNHVDETDNVAEHLAGDNYDGSEELALEFTGDAVTGKDYTVGESAGWSTDAWGVTTANTAATTSSLTLSRHLQHDGATPVDYPTD